MLARLLHSRDLWLAVVMGCFCCTGTAATFLFDATKAEMAGNADWVIEATNHNLRVGSTDGSGTPGSGNESNPTRFPSKPSSGITSTTPETYWVGGLSAWAVDLVKHGHNVETLPYNGRITYLDSTNPQDLTNYNAFVLVEPNILFTAAEKAAIVNFVNNGGGLFIVSDHTGSDRNNDGADSVQVLNGLMTNSVANNPFGIKFNADNISGNFSNTDSTLTDPITHGVAGTAVNFAYNNGATITINTNQNSSVKVAAWSSSTHGTNNGIMVYATYGAGKVVAAGDSSPFDDGTGDPNDSLFYNQGYADPSTSAGILILNGSLWLVQPTQQDTPPTMTLSSTLNQGHISWPTSFVGFTVQSSSTLPGTNWATVTNTASVIGTNFTVTVPFSDSAQVYRLKK